MNELMKVNFENERPTVLGRDLHEYLEVDSNYTTWFKRMTEYGFTDGSDFIPLLEESTGGRPSENHQLTIEMAKEIAMLQRNEKGKQARTYFIQLEKEWNSPEKVMARALRIADTKINQLSSNVLQLESKIELDKPKVLFANSVCGSTTSILIRDLAKLLKQNGVDIGEKRLFKSLRTRGFLIAKLGKDYNSPTQKSMDLKLMEVKETSINHASGHITIQKTPLITGKGQQYFINKFLIQKGA